MQKKKFYILRIIPLEKNFLLRCLRHLRKFFWLKIFYSNIQLRKLLCGVFSGVLLACMKTAVFAATAAPLLESPSARVTESAAGAEGASASSCSTRSKTRSADSECSPWRLLIWTLKLVCNSIKAAAEKPIAFTEANCFYRFIEKSLPVAISSKCPIVQ